MQTKEEGEEETEDDRKGKPGAERNSGGIWINKKWREEEEGEEERKT